MVFDNLSILACANIGAASFPLHGTDAETLLYHSDESMYYAKRNGQAFSFFDTKEINPILTERKLSCEILDAITKNQFVLHYQPIVDLRAKRIVGIEALVRWNHPEHGLIPPLEFIGMAESNGSISALTHWVIETACQQCAEWHQQGYLLNISINLSGRLFYDPLLPRKILDTISNSDLKAHWINLEVTESSAMLDPQSAIETINHITVSVIFFKGFKINIIRRLDSRFLSDQVII